MEELKGIGHFKHYLASCMLSNCYGDSTFLRLQAIANKQPRVCL